MVINREKLNALTDEQLAGLVRSGELELFYLHLHSLHHIREMAGDIEDRSGEIATEATETREKDSDTEVADKSAAAAKRRKKPH